MIFYFNAEFIEIPADSHVKIKIKSKTAQYLDCIANLNINFFICDMNIIDHPIIDDEISLDNGFTKYEDITIKYSTPDLVVETGNCYQDYNIKYTINNHEDPICLEDNIILI